MAVRFLPKDQLSALLAALAQEAAVWTPVSASNGVVEFQRWEPGVEVELEVLLARQSPKELVFPQTETYLDYRYLMACPAVRPDTPEEAKLELEDEGGEVVAVSPPVSHELLVLQEAGGPEGGGADGEESESSSKAPGGFSAQVILGLRPCDARGFAQMDNVFSGYGGFYFDPYYNARRQATALVAVTCQSPRSTCFCRAVGGSPAGTEAVDVLLTEIDGGYGAEAFSEKGEGIVALGALREATAAEAEAVAVAKAEAEQAVEVPFQLEGVREGLRANFADPRWEGLSLRCISCGTCTYVCPNCYCFNINDEIVEGRGERFRCWDNCFNPSYTLETSGHNPRESKTARFRNRFSHKFWYYPEKYDSLLCSGCGRCIMHCPTRIDIREVVRTMGAPAAEQPAPEEE